MSPITSAKQKYIDKLVKLMALASDPSATPAEADAAQAAASKLMAKHNIAIAEAKHAPEYVVEDDMEMACGDKHDTTLANAVARFNGVLLVLHSNKGTNERFLRACGAQGDIDAYNYMKDVVYRQRTDAYFAAIQSGSKKHGIKVRREFYMGFAFGVSSLVTSLLAKRDEVINSMALVPVDQLKQAQAWYEKENGRLSSSRGRKATYDHDGYNAGKNASLNKGVSSNGGGRLAINQ